MTSSSEILKKSYSMTDTTYSFSKSNRFAISPKRSVGFYDLPESKNRRSTSFGIGKRIELFSLPQAPAPGFYDPVEVREKGVKISTSNIGIRLKVPENDVPGPGSYTLTPQTTGPKYSFKLKIKEKEAECICSGSYNPNFSAVDSKAYTNIGFGFGQKVGLSKDSGNPGPGAYSVPTFFPRIKNSVPHSFKKPSKLKRLSNS